MKRTEPRDYENRYGQIEKEPDIDDSRLVDQYQREGNPMPEAVGTLDEFSAEGAPSRDPITQRLKKLCFGNRERNAGRYNRKGKDQFGHSAGIGLR